MGKSLIYNSFSTPGRKTTIYTCIASLTNMGGGVLNNTDNATIWNYHFSYFLKAKQHVKKHNKNVLALKHDHERKA